MTALIYQPVFKTFNKRNLKQKEKIRKANEWSHHVGYTSSRLNTEVKQHCAWIILGFETLQGILASAGTAVVVRVQCISALFCPSGATFPKNKKKN
jgi:hypothetical protein